MSTGAGPDDGPETYLIGGDQSCEHENVAFEGGDGGGNEYYACHDCGGAILREGSDAYQDRQRGPGPRDDDRLRDPTASRGVLTNPQAFAAIRGWLRSLWASARDWTRFVARRLRGEEPEYERTDAGDGGSFDLRVITGEKEVPDTEESDRGRGGERERR